MFFNGGKNTSIYVLLQGNMNHVKNRSVFEAVQICYIYMYRSCIILLSL